MNLSEQPSNLTTFICRHVFEEKRPIAYVFAEDEDGTVSMLCEGSDCDPDDAGNCKLVGIGHMRDYEPALEKLTKLDSGVEAYLTQDKEWILSPIAKGVDQ